jgi:hypothetical protein
MALVAVLALSASALASGRDIIADFQDNGRIDRCYTATEFRQALVLANGEQQQYGALVDVLRAAEVTNLKRPGRPCHAAAPPTPVETGSTSAGSTLAWVGVGLAAAAVAVGVGALARRRRARPPSAGDA